MTASNGVEQAPPAPMVRARGISVIYLEGTPFETAAIEGVNIDIGAGDLLGIVGSTGSGKSTLVQTLCGLLDYSSGEIEYGEGIDAGNPSTSVGLVFQQPEDQIFERTVFEEVAFGPKQLMLDPQEIDRRVRDALQAVGLPEQETLSRSPFEMSGGEKRRVAIASLLAMEPDVLIFDEPTAGLDSSGRTQLLNHIQGLQREGGRTVILISHDMEMLASLVDRLLIMSRGRLVASARPADVYGDPDILIRAGLRPPVWVQVLMQLQRRGLEVSTGVVDPRQAVKEIRRALKSKP